LGSITTALADLELAANKLASSSGFSEFAATSSDTTKATITASSSALLGSYQLAVSSLATAQTLTSGTFSLTTSTLGTGTLTIALGTPSYTGSTPDTYSSFTQTSSVDITIDSSNNTLAGIRDAINASGAGVNASILNNGSTYQLILVSETTGLSNSMAISVSNDSAGTDTDSSGLSQLVYNASANQLVQSVAGSDAAFTLNGISVSSSTNTVAEVIDGVTLNLLGTTSSAITLDVKTDTTAVVANVQSLVDKYNAYQALYSSATGYDALNGIAGSLQGDATMRAVMSQVRDALGANVSGATGAYMSIGDLGLSFDQAGVMSFTQTTFETAFAADASAVIQVFASTTQNSTTVSGVADTLETALETYLQTGGILDTRTDTLNSRLSEISDDRVDLASRMQALEDRLFAQMNAMDSLLAEIEVTGDFLTQQFEAMKPRDR
jgi:flagellar hook-associated protein 2